MLARELGSRDAWAPARVLEAAQVDAHGLLEPPGGLPSAHGTESTGERVRCEGARRQLRRPDTVRIAPLTYLLKSYPRDSKDARAWRSSGHMC